MTTRLRRAAFAAASALFVVTCFATSATAAATAAAPAPATDIQARLVKISIPAPHDEIPQRWLNYPGPPQANVLLPAGYDPHRRYPLLVLLNALANNFDSYRADGIVAMLEAAHLDAIVAMPEGGNGWYADWRNGGHPGGPKWETYELDTVLPTILARFPILPERRFHAIAGFSMGGLGAAYLGGRLPGFFGSVASLSGFVDPQYFSPIAGSLMGLISGAGPREDGLFPVYGAPYGFYAAGHNPSKLAMNLAHTRVFESTGTGVPSAAGIANATAGDPNATGADLYGSALEALIIDEMSQAFHKALVAAGVDTVYEVHPGGHDLPDFDQELTAMLRWGLFKPVPAHPMSWTNDTVATSGRLWDLSFRFARQPTAVVRFQRSGAMLSISTAGTPVTVTTPGGCAIRAATPATVRVPRGSCRD